MKIVIDLIFVFVFKLVLCEIFVFLVVIFFEFFMIFNNWVDFSFMWFISMNEKLEMDNWDVWVV